MSDVVGPVVEGEYEGPRQHGPFAGLLDWVKSQIVAEKTDDPLTVVVKSRPMLDNHECGTARRRR